MGISDSEKLKSELVEELKKDPQKRFDVVLMPHFCIDNILQYKKDLHSFFGEMENVAHSGGGNMLARQSLQRGGKATNCASALSRLGIRSHLVARTNEIGYRLLESMASEADIDLSHVSTDGELALTTSIELEEGNIMIADPGSLAAFGPEHLTPGSEELIGKADLVYVSDWGLNKKGTELAKHVFGVAKQNEKCKAFLDPGDLSPKTSEETESLINDVLTMGLADIISVNEDEAKRLRVTRGFTPARTTRVDLHTEHHAKSRYHNGETKAVPAFDVAPKRLTGAGDTWDAGDILGELMGLSDELRLTLANATAAYYISHPQAKHPDQSDLMDFLARTRFQSLS
ncbi:MAG: carbohydrate kinase family protein [Dehalococcoidia bacterium]